MPAPWTGLVVISSFTGPGLPPRCGGGLGAERRLGCAGSAVVPVFMLAALVQVGREGACLAGQPFSGLCVAERVVAAGLVAVLGDLVARDIA
jgi:hypothetical protein